jgi:hypothetical protein
MIPRTILDLAADDATCEHTTTHIRSLAQQATSTTMDRVGHSSYDLLNSYVNLPLLWALAPYSAAIDICIQRTINQ